MKWLRPTRTRGIIVNQRCSVRANRLYIGFVLTVLMCAGACFCVTGRPVCPSEPPHERVQVQRPCNVMDEPCWQSRISSTARPSQTIKTTSVRRKAATLLLTKATTHRTSSTDAAFRSLRVLRYLECTPTSVRTNGKPNNCSTASFWRSLELPPKVENPTTRYSLGWLRIFYTRTLTRKRHCGNTPPPIRRWWTRYWCRKWSGLTG